MVYGVDDVDNDDDDDVVVLEYSAMFIKRFGKLHT